MKVLWITNQATPELADSIGLPRGLGGGWMNDLSCQLAESEELAIVFPVKSRIGSISGKCGNITYYTIAKNINSVNYDNAAVNSYVEILRDMHPDVIHIWGTEYIHSYEAIIACNLCNCLAKVVISIQGLVSIYATHFWGNLSQFDFLLPSVKDIMRKNGIRRQYRNFIIRGKYEQMTIEKVNHVIGRTDWDYACTSQINPKVHYHFCNETLRGIFYESQWELGKCERHSIFVSQCQYPIKGFHNALIALSIIVKKWPDAHIYTTGKDILKPTMKEKMLMGGYDIYLKKMIHQLKLENYVTFLGGLNEKKMCEQFCKSNVFISASSIENSPNSVGEAMLLGMPVVSSDVGGVKNLLTHGEEGFIYQADAPYMMAYYIDKIFSDDDMAVKIGQQAKKHAMKTHDRDQNFQDLLKAYHETIGS